MEASSKIPVTALVVTKNEALRIEACIKALKDFGEILIVDSQSTDKTQELAKSCGARVENFIWNGCYPKKRQYCLAHLKLAHDWVFFIDADEIATPELCDEIRALDLIHSEAAGYFVRGRYRFSGKMLRFGLQNNKLTLLHRHRMEFPLIDDLDIAGMGEIEGHYQPVLTAPHRHRYIGQLKAPLDHLAYDDSSVWRARHERYAMWESAMDARKAWPEDPKMRRSSAKMLFKAFPVLRPLMAFIHSYIFKLGFLDGRAGLSFAQSRAAYYSMILSASKNQH